MIKALVLLSGGLDSMLAARVLMEQDIEVVGITFISNFFGATNGLAAAKQLGIPLIAYNIAEQHLAMVKNPRYGYGKNMNPCIDCHSMMLAEAKQIMKGKEVVLFYPDGSIKAIAQAYDFTATGEVLGQRPMSQTKPSLKIVAKFSGLNEKLVRPLSAKLLDLTEVEKTGKIDRERLLDISGRSRSRQVELAKQYGLANYPSPAGGCLLTVPDFGVKLKEMLDNWPDCNGKDVELLKQGRQFWLGKEDNKTLVVVGRDEKDNEKLLKLKGASDLILKLIDEVGPIVLVRSKKLEFRSKNEKQEILVPEKISSEKIILEKIESEKEIIDMASMLTGFYAKKLVGKTVNVEITT